MSDEPTPEQLLEQQKKQCVFCKIVNEEIESKKVYEDDKFLAILDIRPAADGHVIVLPKDHVPILAVLPYEHMQQLFILAKKLSDVVREVRAVEKVTIFSASGAAAGQQAPHMLLHIIPREPGDGLDHLDVNNRSVDQADALALSGLFKQATTQVLQQLGRGDILNTKPGAVAKQITPVPTKFESVDESQSEQPLPASAEVVEYDKPNEAIEALLQQNPDLKRMIIAEPSVVEDYITKSENLKKIFQGVNIKALSLMLRRNEQPAEKPAREMTDDELFIFIDGNEGLRQWLLEHPDELAANIGQNAKLQAFFAGVDLLALAKRYKRYKDAA